MIIENLNGLTVLHSEGENKITNSERSLFTNMVYLGKNDNVENYQEVCKDIWKNYVKDEQTDFDILSERIEELQSSILQLEEISLQTDFKLLLLNLRSEDLESQVSPILSKDNLNMVNYTVIMDSKIYELLKKKITRNAYSTRESIQRMLDVYYFSGRITEAEYEELTALLV